MKIFLLFFIISLIYFSCYADCPVTDQYLAGGKVVCLERVDLNSDGRLEEVRITKINKQPSVKSGIIHIEIFDDKCNLLVQDTLMRKFKNFSIEDKDGDECLEVTVLVAKNKNYKKDKYVYHYTGHEGRALTNKETFGQYKVKIYKRIYGLGLFQIFKDEELVYSQKGGKFRIGHIYDNLDKDSSVTIGNDITGDGKPNLVISEWSGGAHCCYNYYVFSLGNSFKFIGKLEGQHSYHSQFKDIDNDGALEFVTNDWEFAYWNTCFAGSPAPEIIFKYKNGQYKLAPELMEKSTPSVDEIDSVVKEIKNSDRWGYKFDWSYKDTYICSDVWAYMLDLIYSGNSKVTIEFLNKVWPEGKPGKAIFLADFKKQLSKSSYWKVINEQGNSEL